MKKIKLPLLLFISFLIGVGTSQVQAQNDHVPGRLMVQLKHGVSLEKVLLDFENSRPEARLSSVKTLSRRINIWLLEFDPNQVSETEFLYEVREHELVEIAQFDHTNLEVRAVPNDPDYDQQWSLKNTGVNAPNGTEDINAEAAWDLSTGGLTIPGDTIVVAVIDEGFDIIHEDINFWKNLDEIPLNGIDDDNNGYVDDYDGWNTYSDTGFIDPNVFPNHGTHVSGIIGAIGNNNIGITGVNWDVEILPVRGSSTLESTVVAAYAYVLEQRASYNESNGIEGAYIVATNSSFGVNFGQPSAYPLWCAFYDTLGSYGILNVGATTNLGINVDTDGDIPTTCPSNYLLSVTNTDGTHGLVSGSGFGSTHIDLGAPGLDIYSTIGSSNYDYDTGTSMSTPHVAGVVALMYSLVCQELFDYYSDDPAGLVTEIRNLILSQGTEASSSLANVTATGGVIDMLESLEAIANYDCTNLSVGENVQDLNGKLFPNPFSDQLWVKLHNPNANKVELSVLNTLGQTVLTQSELVSDGNISISFAGLPSGVYLVRVDEGDGVVWVNRAIKR